jgi:hypothetical protein
MKFSSFFHDPSGDLSMTRLILFIVISGVMIVWIKTAILTGTIPDIPSGVLFLVGGVLGTKLTQNIQEK